MEPLEELIERRDSVKAELIEIEKAISRHPDTIKAAFDHNPMWDTEKFEALVNKVTFIRKQSGQYDRPGGEWHGFVYQIDEKVYRTRYGCSMVVGDDWAECGLMEQEEPIDFKFVEALWGQDDPVTYLEQNNITEDWKVVGHLLILAIVDF